MTTLLTDDFKTELGTVRTFIQTDKLDENSINYNYSVSTTGHTITLERFELNRDWIGDLMCFETSIGWRWFIQKTNDTEENLTIYSRLIDPQPEASFASDTGEHLDAIEIENKTYQLHIGTEDGEMLQNRAEQNDWMPNRFKSEVSIYKSFTEYIDFGFKTRVPKLITGEKIYFHFLVATNLIKRSIQHPDERDVSTWYAVEQTKKFLDNYLDKKNGVQQKYLQ